MTVPIVVVTTPVNGAVDVNITSDIRVKFSTSIDPDSVNIGNAFLFVVDTGTPINGSLSVEDDTIIFRPGRALYENVGFTFSVFGESAGGVAGYIKSTDGDALADTYAFTFNTKVEQYSTLDEVKERADVVIDGPIRQADILEAGGLELLVSDPLGFSSEIATDLSEARFTFSENIDIASLTGNITLETHNVLGDEDQYGAAAASDGELYLQGWEPGTGECDFSQPTGEFAVSGKQIVWSRGAEEPVFNHNTEVVFKITQDIKDVNGHFLIEDAYIKMSTKLFPKFSDARVMRVDCGPMIADQLDDTVNIMIHRNSLDAWYIAAHCFDIHSPYPAVRMFVRNKTIVDLYDMISSRAQVLAGQQKMLGDMEVQYPPAPRLDGPLRRKAEAAAKKKEREMIKYRRQNLPVVAIKGATAGDLDYAGRARRWDIEYEYGSRFYDSVMLRVPASNTTLMRLRKLAYAHDAHPHSTYVTSVCYHGLTAQGVGLFVIPKPTS